MLDIAISARNNRHDLEDAADIGNKNVADHAREFLRMGFESNDEFVD